MPRGTALGLQVVYGGRIESQELDREAIALDRQEHEPIVLLPEPRYIYSNRSYWYPQATVADYATARLEITVPPDYQAVASGTPAGPLGTSGRPRCVRAIVRASGSRSRPIDRCAISRW